MFPKARIVLSSQYFETQLLQYAKYGFTGFTKA